MASRRSSRSPLIICASIWAVALALAAPGRARAEVPKIDVTSTTGINWHTDNDDDFEDAENYDDNYGEAVERLNLSTSHGKWVGGLRLDVTGFFSEPEPADPEIQPHPHQLKSRYENRYTLEKIYLGWRSRDVEVRLGDSYASLGRGLTLSIRKVDELGVDSSVRGAKVLVHKGSLSAKEGYTTGTKDIEALVGKEGVVHTQMHPTGTVIIDGEKVEGTAQVGSIEEGTRVRVVGTQRFGVVVEKVEF